MRIFLSYASEDRRIAEKICARLELENHEVFFDRDDLEAGAGYDQAIRQEIERCDLFIFIISPDSVADGRYTLTELGFARRNFRNLNRRVLPVQARDTELDDIPAVLQALDFLTPAGNLEAEVVARVAQIADWHAAQRKKRWVLFGGAAVPIVVAIPLLISALQSDKGEEAGTSEQMEDTPPVETAACPDMSRFEGCASQLAALICTEQSRVASAIDGGLSVDTEPAAPDRRKVYLFGAVNSRDDLDASQLETLLNNVRNAVGNLFSLDAVPPHGEDAAFLAGPVVARPQYESSDDALIILSSQLNPPYDQGGVTMREGESAFYFGEDPGISLSFRLPENRFGEPLNLHKAAIAYSRARSELDLRQKKRLLDSAWEFVQNACPEE